VRSPRFQTFSTLHIDNCHRDEGLNNATRNLDKVEGATQVIEWASVKRDDAVT
jgi:hypothetical protein